MILITKIILDNESFSNNDNFDKFRNCVKLQFRTLMR